VLIERFDLGEQYLLYVDTTQSLEKVLNCSKAALEVPSNQTAWAREYVFGLLHTSQFDAMEQCTSSGGVDCQRWKHDNTFSAGCLNNKSYIGHDKLMYLIEPRTEPVSPSTSFSVLHFTNDIYYPPDQPKLCRSDSADHTWWYGARFQTAISRLKVL
jgi:hypothetical protein